MPLPLTGERTVPGVASERYWFRRHVAAYRFAAGQARGVVVDAGSGEGYGSALLARRARRVISLELDAAAASHAARTYPEPSILRADLCRPPLRERSVDGVVALQVVEHLACAEAFVAACAAALRPGGVLVVSTPNRATFPAGLNPFHTHEYEAPELASLLRGSFPDVGITGVRHRTPLAALDSFLGEPVQHRLVREPYERQPAWLRAVLRSFTARDFAVGGDPATALDLVAVARIEP